MIYPNQGQERASCLLFYFHSYASKYKFNSFST